MANGKNMMRDMRRDILRAVRESQKAKQDALDEYVAAQVAVRSLEARLRQAVEAAHELRRKAKKEGNSALELKTADELIDSRWAEPEPVEPAEPGVTDDEAGTVEEPAGTAGGADGDGMGHGWEEGRS